MHECMLCINVCVCAKSANVYEYMCIDHIFVIVNKFVFEYSQMCVYACVFICVYDIQSQCWRRRLCHIG